MGIVSTTRTIFYCMSAVLVTGTLGFTLNAYFLKILRDEVKALEREIASLRSDLAAEKKSSGSSNKGGETREEEVEKIREEEEDDDEEFHIALESIPSQSSLSAVLQADISCTDSRCERDLLEICRSIDERHDVLKVTEQGCEQSLDQLRQLNSSRPNTPQIMWRLVRMMFEEGKHNARAGLDSKTQLVEALDIARSAVDMGEQNSKCHLWYAILLGDTCKYDDTKAKLTKGMEFDKHVRISLQLDPHNSTALHLLGRYCYEVAGIKWWEAKIAATLFGSVPQSTYDEALKHFLAADELNSEWVENTLFIVKCLVALGREKKARVWIARIKDPEKELASQVEELRNKL